MSGTTGVHHHPPLDTHAPLPCQPSSPQVIKQLLASRPRSATLEADLLEASRATLPTTYLQLAGQRLLHHARTQLPALLGLPVQPPGELIGVLYTQPFAAAVSLVS